MKTSLILNLTQHTATPAQVEAGVYEPQNKAEVQQWLTFTTKPNALSIKLAAKTLAVHASKEALDKINPDELSTITQKVFELTQYGEKFKRDLLSMLNVKVMIGGAPFLMPQLEAELRKNGLTPVYAFSERKVMETTDNDGQVQKKVIFEHKGFIEAIIVE